MTPEFGAMIMRDLKALDDTREFLFYLSHKEYYETAASPDPLAGKKLLLQALRRRVIELEAEIFKNEKAPPLLAGL